MSDLLPDEELAKLVALERRAATAPDPDAVARLAARLAPQLSRADAGSAQPAPGRAGGVVSKRSFVTGAGGLGIGLVAGAIVTRLAAPAPRVEVRYVDRIVEVPRSAPSPDSGDAAAAEPPSPPTPSAGQPASPPTSPRPAAQASSVNPDEALARERQVIEKASSAIAHRDGASALAAVEEHAKAFPRGQLVEMREALAVQALVQAGRVGEARSRAARFRQSFPGSLYGGVVDAALPR